MRRLHQRHTSITCLILTLVGTSLTAATIDSLGTIDFPNSGSEAAQEPFIRGVLLLHSFEYEDAAEAFREAQAIDANFALAYWGEAMTHNHPLWRQKDREAALIVLDRLATTPEERCAKARTERECGYIEAVEILYEEGDKVALDFAYSDAMERLSAAYPDDLEAKSFYALSILGTTQAVRDFATYMRAAAIVEDVFAANPRHPGAVHYLIHSYDDPIHAPLGLRAARVYAEIAPAASHAQHMISHIYVALGRWGDSVESNINAFEVSRLRAERKNLPVDELNYHAFHWLQYSYLQLGELTKALEMLYQMHEYALESGSRRARGYYAAMRASYLTEAGSEGVPPTLGTETMSQTDAAADLFASGYRALGSGSKGAAENCLAKLEQIAEELATEPSSKIVEERRQVVGVLTGMLAAELALTVGDADRADELLQDGTAVEGAMPLEYGPPQIVKPSHELYGEVLLKHGRPQEAQLQFEVALARAPRRRQSLAGLAQAATTLGDEALAAKVCADLDSILGAADPGVGRPPVCGEAMATADLR